MRRGIWFGIVAAAIGLGVILWPEDTADDATISDLPGESTSSTTSTTAVPSSTSSTSTTTTTTEPTPPATVECPDPPDLTDALHLSPNRTPLDVDRDGAPDEFLWIDDGRSTIVVRLASGRIVAGPSDAVASPVLVDRPDGGAASVDLDGDGDLEFFIGGYGNTARNAVMFSVDGCDLQRIEFATDTGEDPGGFILIGVGGNSCSPTGCFSRVRCDADALVLEVLAPGEEWRGTDANPDDVEMRLSGTAYALDDGRLIELVERNAGETIPFGLIDDTHPSAADSDVIACG